MTPEDYAQYMRTHKFDPETRPEDRGDAIHSAILDKRVHIAIELLTLYPKDCLEARSRKGSKKWRTPLHSACELGRTEIVKSLLDKGADVNARSFHQLTPLIFAAEAENLEIVRLLISQGAEVNAQSDKKTNTRSALHVAAQIESPSIILALLLNGAEPKLVTIAGNTPLHLAIQSGCTSAAALLLFHGASPTITNEKGASPRSLVEGLRQGDHKRFSHIFECASEKGDFGNFFDRHVKPDKPIDMIAAIHWAIAHNLDRAIAYLLHIDSHIVEARSPQRWHPLHRAARDGYENCVLVLLEHGAKVDCTTKSGWTPLMMAAEKGDKKVLHILLDHGASRVVKNDNGDTAWKVARHNGHRLPMLLAIKHVAPSEVDGKDNETDESDTLKPPKDRPYCRTPSPGPGDDQEKVGKFIKECLPRVFALLTYVGELYTLYDAKIDETSVSSSEKFVSLLIRIFRILIRVALSILKTTSRL